MNTSSDPFSFVVTTIAGWINRHQQQVIEYLFNFVHTGALKIRAGRSDTSHAGGIDRKANDVAGDLLFGNRLCVNLPNRSRVSEFRKSTLC